MQQSVRKNTWKRKINNASKISRKERRINQLNNKQFNIISTRGMEKKRERITQTSKEISSSICLSSGERKAVSIRCECLWEISSSLRSPFSFFPGYLASLFYQVMRHRYRYRCVRKRWCIVQNHQWQTVMILTNHHSYYFIVQHEQIIIELCQREREVKKDHHFTLKQRRRTYLFTDCWLIHW